LAGNDGIVMGLLPGVDGGIIGVCGRWGAGDACGSAGPTVVELGIGGNPIGTPDGTGINGGPGGPTGGASGAPSVAAGG
jgi:hypothetical protein